MHIIMVQSHEMETAEFLRTMLEQLDFARSLYSDQSANDMRNKLIECMAALDLNTPASVYGNAIDIAVIALRLALETENAKNIEEFFDDMFPELQMTAEEKEENK